MRYNTGNPVGPDGSSDPRDLYDTAGIADLFVNGSSLTVVDRTGNTRKSMKGIEKDAADAMLASGLEFIGDYDADGPLNITRQNQAFSKSGEYWRPGAGLSLPYTTLNNWAVDQPKFVSTGDASLRTQLAATDSSIIISGVSAQEIADLARAITIDADGQARSSRFIAGGGSVTGSQLRDAYVVARTLNLSDTHGFRDQTLLSSLLDYGGYGVFDAIIRLIGSGAYDHMFSLQDRNEYAGSGTLNHMGGLVSFPSHTGTGTLMQRLGVDIQDIGGTGPVTENVGVLIRDLQRGTGKAGLVLLQTAGLAINASGGAPSYHAGPLAIGVSADTNGQYLSIKGSPTGPTFFASATGVNVQLGALSDAPVQLITGGGIGVEVANAAASNAFRPGHDNSQPNGDASRVWSVVWAGSGSISVSDGRKKTPVRKFSDSELNAAKQLAAEIGAYKFLASVAEKGSEAREHIGMTVQRAKEIMESNGLDPFGYSFICYDKWEKQTVDHPDEVIEHPEVIRASAVTDDRGQPFMVKVSDAWTELVKPAWTETTREAGDLYSFRMDGLLAFIAAGFEARLSAIET
ncbi:tail fiber domain-containing protein [Pseudomonas poae]|uniref:Peptidase S74 domain-containing protein n=1 Tax=Pseudomonas poae TaxID=200451 RepID=A0A2S9EUB7_9PSED|nr:tail fiber domain-containing protein [Pseudomonas poae]PRA33816.1 hypothetical protein CQZ97_01000 [Pseudomonas poae]PRC19594.1 hypothetical protein CQZ99_09605 [Pseudomonas poae]